MANRFAGLAFVNVSGSQMPVRANCTIRATMTQRTGIAGQDGVHGYSEMPTVPAIEFDISMLEGISAEDIGAMDDETVSAETASGRVYTLRNAWRAGPSEINTAEGTMRVRFEGLSMEEFS